MLHVLGLRNNSRSWLRLHCDDAIDTKMVGAFTEGCKRLLSGEPLAYIIGYREFYGLNLSVDSRVLDPRSDSEVLVDWALEVLISHTSPYVSDLGTGSGAIALSIKRHRPDAHVVGIDLSLDAIQVARDNAAKLNVDVHFVAGTWLEPLSSLKAQSTDSATEGWHLIVSNPPYIADGDAHLDALKFEPRMALTSGADGLDDIRHLISEAPQHLTDGGWLLLEHGYDQAQRVRNLMQSRGFQDISTRNDLAGIERCTGGRWRSNRKAG